MRNGLRRIAEIKQEWAGLPMPLEGQPLVIHPGYSWASDLMKIGAKTPPDDVPADVKLRNRFWSTRLRNYVCVWDEAGKIEWACLPRRTELDLALQTLGSADAWGIEQEGRAVRTLGEMLKHRPFKQYLQTGMFQETSARSGLTYLFRRLRPTVVLDARDKDAKATRVLCALCLHPIGYYEDSWAGAMCPTDDVIAHLSLMRGDEAMFWRRANQHAPGRPEAAI